MHNTSIDRHCKQVFFFFFLIVCVSIHVFNIHVLKENVIFQHQILDLGCDQE